MGNKIITVGRQFGSNGRIIGKMVAERMGIECYDNELITMAAKQGNLNIEALHLADEKKASPLWYSINSEIAIHYTEAFMPVNDRLVRLQSDVIRELADRESCVIVGRCADWVLDGRKDVISVFIAADFDSRVKTVMDRTGKKEKEVVQWIKKVDRERSAYYNYYTEKRWGRQESYHICLNSSRLGPEVCVDILCAVCKK